MKTIYNITIIIGCIFTFFACSSTPKNDSNMFNFGTYTYDEPFVGLLKSRPKVLVKSLDYPPFSWCKPDTAHGIKNFNIAFNEECVRSHSVANIQFRDTSYVPTTGIMIFHAEKPINFEGITISADTIPQELSLKFIISPQMADTSFVGTMFIKGNELDEVNDTALQQENQAIRQWTFTQELGWPILLWLLWLISALFIIALALFIVTLIVRFLCNIFKTGSSTVKVSEDGSLSKGSKEKYSKKTSNEQTNENWRKEIKRKTNWADVIINALRSKEEAEIYIRAGLQQAIVGGKFALINPNINWSAYNCRKKWLKNKLSNWEIWKDYNNADLIGEGFPPRDENGDPYELHHIGQEQDSPFAELCWNDHMGDGNNKILHPKRESEIDRQLFDKEKAQYWMNRFKLFTEEELNSIYKHHS